MDIRNNFLGIIPYSLKILFLVHLTGCKIINSYSMLTICASFGRIKRIMSIIRELVLFSLKFNSQIKAVHLVVIETRLQIEFLVCIGQIDVVGTMGKCPSLSRLKYLLCFGASKKPCQSYNRLDSLNQQKNCLWQSHYFFFHDIRLQYVVAILAPFGRSQSFFGLFSLKNPAYSAF